MSDVVIDPFEDFRHSVVGFLACRGDGFLIVPRFEHFDRQAGAGKLPFSAEFTDRFAILFCDAGIVGHDAHLLKRTTPFSVTVPMTFARGRGSISGTAMAVGIHPSIASMTGSHFLPRMMKPTRCIAAISSPGNQYCRKGESCSPLIIMTTSEP